MRKYRILALLLVAVLLLAGCSAPSEGMQEKPAGTVAGNGVYEEGKADQNSTGVEEGRKLIRTVTIEAETADLDVILSDLDAQLAALGGYVQNKSVQNGRNGAARYATMTLRIPADQLDSFVGHVENATNILSSNEKAEDVTLKYAATESRIKALETEEARLLELLEKAENLNNLLTLESKLADVREELETVKSQLKLYDSLVDYGTVHLTIKEVKEYTVVEEEEPTAWERIGTGFVSSVKGVWKILTELFIFFVVALPYLVIPAVIVVIIVLVHRKKKVRYPKFVPSNPMQTPEQPKEE